MSNIYNFASQISEGNHSNEVIRGINRQIDAQNSIARDNFNSLRQSEKENKQVAKQNLNENEVGDREQEGEEGGKVLSAVNDLVASRNNSKAVNADVDKEVSDSSAPQSEGGNQNVLPDEGKTELEGDVDLVREKTDFDSDRLFTTEGAGYDLFGNRGFGTGISTGRPLPSGAEGSNFVIRAYPVNEGRPSGVSDMIKPIENNVAMPVAEDLPKSGNFIKSMGKSGGLLGEGVSGALKGATILTGGYDAVKDIADPKSFGKLNAFDKVSNIANVVSGGLETAGLGIASTGIGLPLAGLVEGAGLVSGAVGLGAGLIGDITGEKKQKQQVANMPAVAPQVKAPQQKQVSFKSAFEGGGLVQ